MGPVKNTVLDVIQGYINPKPLTVDSDGELDADVTKFQKWHESSDDDFEPFPSKGLKRSLDLSEHERYAGKKLSRRKVSKENNQVNTTEKEIRDFDSAVSSESDSLVDADLAGNSESSVTSSGSDGDMKSDVEDEQNTPFQNISQQNVREEIEKGKAVKHQLEMWDSLLECRIKFQKCLMSANSLPQFNIYKKVLIDSDPELKVAVQSTRRSVSKLLSKLLELRVITLNSFKETTHTSNVQQKEDENDLEDEILSSEEDNDLSVTQQELQRQTTDHLKGNHKVNGRNYGALLKEIHENYREYRNATIQKWNDKTRVAVGNLSNKNFSAFEQSTLSQIEQVLSDRQRLVQRTQVKRANYTILGKDGGDEERDTEVFDDGDWYQQLVRELIEHKCAGVADPSQLGHQWLQLQKLRSKMKRKVDTRATKGRKVSYAVHPKLVSFMAPVVTDVWSDTSCSELYTSLFSSGATLP